MYTVITTALGFSVWCTQNIHDNVKNATWHYQKFAVQVQNYSLRFMLWMRKVSFVITWEMSPHKNKANSRRLSDLENQLLWLRRKLFVYFYMHFFLKRVHWNMFKLFLNPFEHFDHQTVNYSHNIQEQYYGMLLWCLISLSVWGGEIK